MFIAYKRKADKVQPVLTSESSGEKPGGSATWKDEVLQQLPSPDNRWIPPEFREFVIPRVSAFPRGSRLTSERAERLRIGTELSAKERRLLFTILYIREAALSWDWEEAGRLQPEVYPPIKIRTVKHTLWQARQFAIPKPLQEIATKIFRDRMSVGVLKVGFGPYRNI